ELAGEPSGCGPAGRLADVEPGPLLAWVVSHGQGGRGRGVGGHRAFDRGVKYSQLGVVPGRHRRDLGGVEFFGGGEASCEPFGDAHGLATTLVLQAVPDASHRGTREEPELAFTDDAGPTEEVQHGVRVATRDPVRLSHGPLLPAQAVPVRNTPSRAGPL